MVVPERSRRIDALHHPDIHAEGAEVGRLGEGARHGQRDTRRGHADDLVVPERGLEHRPDDGGIATEASLVVLVTEHHPPRGAGPVILGAQQAAECGARAEDAGDLVRGHRDPRELGVAAARHRHGEGAIDAEVGERARVTLEVDVAAGRHAPALRTAPRDDGGMHHRDEPVGVGIGERAQHDGVEHGEHRGRRTDAERERDAGDDAEPAVPYERPRRVARLAPQRGDEVRAPFLPDGDVVDRGRLPTIRLRVAEPSAHLGIGLLGRQARGDELGTPLLHMEAQFLVHLGGDARGRGREREGALGIP
jgi:hypothetical protein